MKNWPYLMVNDKAKITINHKEEVAYTILHKIEIIDLG